MEQVMHLFIKLASDFTREFRSDIISGSNNHKS